jgi:hypothetical protein
MHDDKNDKLRDEVERVMDDLAEEATPGIARAPRPEPVAPDEREAEPHEHPHHFQMFTRDEEGELVEVDPETIGNYVDEDDDEDGDEPRHHGDHR